MANDFIDDECVSCGVEPENECPNSKRACGHHCNHSWSHDECCWCGEKFGPLPEPYKSWGGWDISPEMRRRGYEGSKLRRGLRMEMPQRIAVLERDKRGYPIPWNVLRGDDGTPLFTVNDDRKAWRALREKLCPICGERLGRWLWFTGGPASAFHPNGWFLDLPAHEQCAEYALATCPYLAAPKYLKRIDVVDPSKLPEIAKVLLDETMDPERPEVFVMVTGSGIEYKERGAFQPYVRPLRPLVEWRFWRHGKQITEQEAKQLLEGSWLEGARLEHGTEKTTL